MVDNCIGPYIETLLFYIMMLPMVGDSVFFFGMQYLAIRVPGTSLESGQTHTHIGINEIHIQFSGHQVSTIYALCLIM